MPLNYLRSSTLSAMRTYRIEVIGQFDRPQGVVRERLLARAPHHELITSAFTPEGTFSYNASLTRFTFKYLVTSDADSAVAADASAAEEAELKALNYPSGLSPRPRPASTTSSPAVVAEALGHFPIPAALSSSCRSRCAASSTFLWCHSEAR